jgi:hypothetical protein
MRARWGLSGSWSIYCTAARRCGPHTLCPTNLHLLQRQPLHCEAKTTIQHHAGIMKINRSYRVFSPYHHNYLHDVYTDPSEILVHNPTYEIRQLKDTATIDERSIVISIHGINPEFPKDCAAFAFFFARMSVSLCPSLDRLETNKSFST